MTTKERSLLRYSLVPVVGLALMACGATLRVFDVGTTQALFPFLSDHPTRQALVERLGEPSRYVDASSKVLIFEMAADRSGTLVVSDSLGVLPSHELVLIFDEQDRLKRYSLIKVR